MDFRFNEEEESFRKYVHEFFQKNVTPGVIEDYHRNHRAGGPHAAVLLRQGAEAGLVALTCPKEYGGRDLPPSYSFIVSDAASRFSAPEWCASKLVARPLMKFGSEYLKNKYLPKILAGEIDFCIGFTEPDAGSDLASLKTRAVEDGDDYVINGQKIFTTAAHVVDCVWLLARTDPDKPKHQGVSLFIVDLKTPGITISPLHTMDGGQTNAVFYDDVRVPKSQMVGERGRGFYIAMESLSHERHLVFPTGRIEAMLDVLIAWAREAKRDGKPVCKDPIIRHKLARLAIEVQTSLGLELKVLDAVMRGQLAETLASMHKLYGSQLEQRLYESAMDIMGAYGQLCTGSKHAPAEGEFEVAARRAVVTTLGGGTSEVQKNIIAGRHLHLRG